MAQSKKTSSKSKSTSTKKKTTKKAQPTQPPEPVVPVRREMAAVVFLFLAIFIGISYFKNEGAFVLFFSNLIKGLVGWGYWLITPVFLVISYALFFHRGRPVALRLTSALLLPVIISAIISLFAYEYDMRGADIRLLCGLLFEQGQMLNSGGVLGGLAAVGLEMAFSIYGALPVLFVLLVICCIFTFNVSLKKTAERVKIEVQTKYDPSMYEDALTPISAASANIHANKDKKKIERVVRQNSFVTDIPLGDDDDVLSLLDGRTSASSNYASSETKPKRKAKTPISIETGVTDGVKPASLKEAAKIAGLELDEPELKPVSQAVPKPIKNTRSASTLSVEISEPPKVKRIPREELAAEAKNVAEEIEASEDRGDYSFPPLSLLRSSVSSNVDSREETMVNRTRLEAALKSFGISAKIVGVTNGPTVTRYDIELESGVKLARITNLAGDLALALGVINVRIAPIPNKISTVGIEVPNRIVSTVYLRDIIDTPQFSSAKSKLSFAIGKDIGGESIIGNISKLPHMLIAGTTGSGKSVCMNSLILSLLYKAKPDEVKLIMIDPKMVELGVYNGIPHLYVPVVTDPKKAAGALQWSVVEMLKRYRLFSEIGVRDIENYNKHCAACGEQTLPQVVIVIDELADLMLVASKDVEESICRVAQMGRAAGMHLIIATQRPSADVITGLMKANIPSRIAFAVSSAMESRIILDQGGAEKLVGMGDMLYSPVGSGKPMRIQGAFVSDEEREEVIQFIKDGSGSSQLNNEIEEFMNKAVEDKGSHDSSKASKEEKANGAYDEMLPQAVEVVLETKSCSVSMLQRRVKLGYSRAARIVDQMEELGIVGPYEGAKPRAVVIDREGWIELQHQLGLINDEDYDSLLDSVHLEDDTTMDTEEY